MSLALSPPTPVSSVTGAGVSLSTRRVIGRMQRRAITAAGCAALASTVVLLLVQDGATALSGLLGAIFAVGAFWSGIAAITAVLEGPSRTLMLNGLLVYGVHVALLVGLALGLRSVAELSGLGLTVGLLSAGLAYVVFLVQAFLTARLPVVEVSGDEQ